MPKTSRNDRIEAIIAPLIEMIGEAKGIWDMPWRNQRVRPTNALTGRRYSGFNSLNLMIAGLRYGSPYWATFKQARSMELTVRRGERGTPIMFYSPIPEEKQKPDGPTFVLRFSHVFNIDQMEGETDSVGLEEDPANIDAINATRDFIARTPIETRTLPGSPAYNWMQDHVIMLPEREFHDDEHATATEHYLSTYLHELVHATGHASRLARPFSKEIEVYAFEELIAEIGSAFLSIDLGLCQTFRRDHAEYLAHWRQQLNDDPRAIIKAAREAEKAVTWLQSNLRDSGQLAA